MISGADPLSVRPAIRTTCPYCGVGCGVLAQVQPDGSVTISGDPAHPANFGRLCSKGLALGETVGHDHRLRQPRVDGQAVSWDMALTRVAEGFQSAIDQYGPDAVAFYVSGQLLTEDYYIANKLMKGYIGSANIDTNSRLCMSSAVAGHKRAFGSDTVPGCYEDLEQADVLILVGSNLAWCHPVLYRRIEAAKAQRPDLSLVVIDPRRTPSCDLAGLHLSIRPGSDVLLFNGLLAHLAREGRADFAFLESHASGYAATLAAARDDAPSIPAVAAGCGVSEEDIAAFFRLFARTERVVTLFSQGVNQSSAGTDKVNAIINCHLFTGRIGRTGMGPFSITGQPNAMGGREVGGLANQLAAHLDLESPEHQALVQRFWGSPVIARRSGLKAVELFEAVGEGRIKALWIMATNPVVSLPDADRVKDALRRCPLLVVSDMCETDTTALGHVVLPAATWGEREGTVTNSERCISRQRAFLDAPGEARPDWWVVQEVARRMGFGAGFNYLNVAEIFREHAQLSAFENSGMRDFDLSGFADVDRMTYEAMDPIRWPVRTKGVGTDRMFVDGHFYTPDARARLVPVRYRAPVHAPHADYPLVLNTGRIRDQWHTMTRTGRSPRLSTHLTEPYAELHPRDAAVLGIADRRLVHLETPWGRMLARARLTGDQRPGTVFVPMHWNDVFAGNGRVDALVNPVVDPISGEPEFKHTPVRISAYACAWQGFALVRGNLETNGVDYWVRSMGARCSRYELADTVMPGDWSAWAMIRLGHAEADEWLEFQDAGTGRYRAALIRAGRLESCLFVSRDGNLPARQWLESLFAAPELDSAARMSLLAGRSPVAGEDQGEIVCSCFQVGRNRLLKAITQGEALTLEAIGQKLQAGTGCGSCVPELKRLLANG
jgi:assimilatory nitrate reductase catalytic subunit